MITKFVRGVDILKLCYFRYMYKMGLPGARLCQQGHGKTNKMTYSPGQACNYRYRMEFQIPLCIAPTGIRPVLVKYQFWSYLL